MNILRSTAMIGGLTLVSRILGFAREILIAWTIGAGAVSDAYYTALQFPNLFRRVFAEGAFSQAFVPLFSRTTQQEGEAAASRVASETYSALFAATAALTIAAQLLMPAIMLVMQYGYVAREDWDIFWLSVFLTQITMPYLTAMSLAALFQGVLNTHSRFALAAAAPTILNVFLAAQALMFHGRPLVAVYALAVAVMLAGVAQAAMLYWGCRRLGIRLQLMRPRATPAVRRVVAVAVPGAIAASAVQINITISQSLASLEEGAKSWLSFADRLYQLPLGLVGVALGVAILPALSRAVSSDDRASTQSTLDQALAIAMALTLPAAAALMAIPTLLSDALFTRGEFTASDAAMTGAALLHFGWGVPAFVLIKVLAPAFYARHDTVRPMRYAMVSVVINIVIGAGLFFLLRERGVPGFPGLAIGTSAAAWINAGLLLFVLVRDDVYRPGAACIRRIVGALAASAAMVAVLLLAQAEYEFVRGLAFGAKEGAAAIITTLGALAYFAAAFVTGALRPSDLRALVRKRRVA
jgi:putative peptidoglycan lipid II flippase